MTGVGPFPLPAALLLLALAGALGVAWTLTRAAPPERARPLSGPLLDLLIVGLVVARLGFVLAHAGDYAAEPLAVLMVGDGGYWPWAGIAGALAFGAWRTRAEPWLRRPLAVAAGSGLLAWLLLGVGAGHLQRRQLPLPDLRLAVLGEALPRRLDEPAGRPRVINLWATWCPPCRQELPALIAAQAAHPEIAFLYVNAGEDAAAISRYLQASGQTLAPVLLDPQQALARRLGAGGLPTTLFYAADGRLVAVHQGALSRASLAARLAALGR